MKKRKSDIVQDILMTLLRPLVFVWMRYDAKRKVIFNDFKPWRKEPYIMLANHTFMFDVLHVPLRLFKQPFVVASQTLFTMQPTKFLLSKVGHAIPKSKGASDLRTAKELISAVRRGYPILIFPEGDTTFYGQTNYIEESTMKLIKKLKVDLVTCHVSGGYLSKPRWATGKRKNRNILLEYKITIPKDKIKDMSLEDISKTVNEALYNNDYEYQRKMMIPHPGKNLAEGIENAVYICPVCESVNSIMSDRNTFQCKECKTEGHIDKYGFLHGFPYDNLIEWDAYQRKFLDKLLASRVETSGRLFFVSLQDGVQREVGQVSILYENGFFIFDGPHQEKIPVEKISNPTITLRRDFGFFYEDRYYLIKLDAYGASLLRIAQLKY